MVPHFEVRYYSPHFLLILTAAIWVAGSVVSREELASAESSLSG
jgi:hypothetical protein